VVKKYHKIILFYSVFLLILNFCDDVLGKNITIASWGGAYTESQVKAYKNTYKNPSAIKFVNYNGGLEDVRQQIESGKIKWDVIDVLPMDAIQGCQEGLFRNISSHYKKFPKGPNNTSMLDDMKMTGISYDVPKCCAPQIFWSYVVFYDPDSFPGEKPNTVSDFFNVKKFPGKRAINTWATGPLMMAMLASGEEPKNVYRKLKTKNGRDIAFKYLDKIKNDVIFWSSGSKPLELISSGEALMAIAYNGRVGAANLSQGTNYEYIWDSQVIDQEYLCIVNGTKNFNLALDFLKHATSPESLAKSSKYITYGPMRASSVDIINGNEPWGNNGEYISDHLPNTPERLKNSVMVDPYFQAWEINIRYDDWMNKK